MRLSYAVIDVAMAYLTEFERGMIVGARLAGTSVKETTIILGRSRSTVSDVMTTYGKVGKIGTEKHNSGWKKNY